MISPKAFSCFFINSLMWWFCARHARQLRPRRRARPARAAAAVDPLVTAAMLPPLGRERAAGTHGRGGCRRARQARRRAQRGVRAVARGRIARRLALLNLDDFHLPPELQVFAQVLHLSLVFCQQLLHLALVLLPQLRDVLVVFLREHERTRPPRFSGRPSWGVRRGLGKRATCLSSRIASSWASSSSFSSSLSERLSFFAAASRSRWSSCWILSDISACSFSCATLFWCSYSRCFTFCLYTCARAVWGRALGRLRPQSVSSRSKRPAGRRTRHRRSSRGLRCLDLHLVPLFELLHLAVLVSQLRLAVLQLLLRDLPEGVDLVPLQLEEISLLALARQLLLDDVVLLLPALLRHLIPIA